MEQSAQHQQTKRKFTAAEDTLLLRLVQEYGTGDWKQISEHMEHRTGRQCRERWRNYISPDLKREKWTPEEDLLLIRAVEDIGKKWSKMTSYFPNRAGVSLKNRYRHLVKSKVHEEDNETESSDVIPTRIVPQVEVNTGQRGLVELPCPLSMIHELLCSI